MTHSPVPLWPGSGPVWIMGCGNMGGALLQRWLASGLEASRVTVIDPAPANIDGIKWVPTVPEGAPALLILGIKPQMIAEGATLLANNVGPETILLSMLAGVECDTLAGHFPKAKAIVRIMPNLPVALGKGVSGLYSSDANADDRAAIDALLAPTGMSVWLDQEELFHAVVAVSGSGPAFVYRFISAITEAGAALGLPVDQALTLARATVEGAAALATDSDIAPDELARRVASPQGTTAEGLAVLDQDGVFKDVLARTLEATARRSREMAEGR